MKGFVTYTVLDCPNNKSTKHENMKNRTHAGRCGKVWRFVARCGTHVGRCGTSHVHVVAIN